MSIEGPEHQFELKQTGALEGALTKENGKCYLNFDRVTINTGHTHGITLRFWWKGNEVFSSNMPEHQHGGNFNTTELNGIIGRTELRLL